MPLEGETKPNPKNPNKSDAKFQNSKTNLCRTGSDVTIFNVTGITFDEFVQIHDNYWKKVEDKKKTRKTE